MSFKIIGRQDKPKHHSKIYACTTLLSTGHRTQSDETFLMAVQK